MTSILEIVLHNLLFVFLINGSILFQKLGVLQGPKFGEEANVTVIKGFIKNKSWLIGIGLNAISIPYYMFILSITSLSFNMVFQRVGIIIILLFSIYYLKEKMNRTEVLGLVVLYTGFILAVLVMSPGTTAGYSNDLGALIYLVVSVALYVNVFFIYKKIKNAKLKEIVLAIGAGLSGVSGSIALKLIPMALARDLHSPGYVFNFFNFMELGKLMVGIFLPASGYFFASIYFYFWIGNFTANFFLMMMMFQHGRAIVTIPLMNSLNFMISVLFANIIFMEELNFISWLGISLMVGGIILTSKFEVKIVQAEKYIKEKLDKEMNEEMNEDISGIDEVRENATK
ncbi:MAG: hypothetical protein ACTSVI_12085 [Promethearchaeota archaeon]